MATRFPNIAEEWDYSLNDRLPTEVSSGSKYKAHWICKSGHRWITSVERRTDAHNGTDCPYCCGKLVVPGCTDCATMYPNLLMEWSLELNKVPLSEISHGDERLYWWVCKHGHRFQMSPNHRTSRNSGCPYCAGKKVLKGFNDLLSQQPSIVSEWDLDNNLIKPDEIAVCSNKLVWWKCRYGHRWKTSAHLRVNNHTGCPVCNQSHGEKRIREYLDMHHFRYLEQYVFPDRFIHQGHYLKDDFALLDDRKNVVMTIEYHGIQHYKSIEFYGGQQKLMQTQKLDAYKTQYLYSRNIPQLIIPYTEFTLIENILNAKLSGVADKISK